jgi:hypothetical protein
MAKIFKVSETVPAAQRKKASYLDNGLDTQLFAQCNLQISIPAKEVMDKQYSSI